MAKARLTHLTRQINFNRLTQISFKKNLESAETSLLFSSMIRNQAGLTQVVKVNLCYLCIELDLLCFRKQIQCRSLKQNH